MTRPHMATPADLAPLLPPREKNTHKGSYGYVAVLGGCAEYSGAPKLANLAQSALRAGCGVATLAVPSSLAGAVAPYLLESTLYRIPDRDTWCLMNRAFRGSLPAGVQLRSEWDGAEPMTICGFWIGC